jgi:hypothetical protein
VKPFLVRVRFQDGLAVKAGKLAAAGEAGEAVHAAAFLDRRLIVLDRALIARPRELKRIWIHELFHFVWWRLGNARRLSWEQLVLREVRSRAAGELGWSSEWRKRALAPADRRGRTRRWREYCCESFCDSAAWLLSGASAHAEFTLAREHRAARRRWLREFLRYNSR